MIELIAEFVDLLLNGTNLPALVGTRIYGGQDLPPEYIPADGPAVLVRLYPSGEPQDYSSQVYFPRFEVRCYGNEDDGAMAVANALYDDVNDYKGGRWIMVRLDQSPQLLTEPNSELTFALVYYRATVRR